MIQYDEATCIICQNKLLQGEDIVVCPECGTPYHRSCWQAEGHCVNTELHATGGSWMDAHHAEMQTEECICPHCQTSNSQNAVRCVACGNPLSNAAQKDTFVFRLEDPYCGIDPEEDFDGAKLSELKEYVGKNTMYYLPIFKSMKESGKRISFNLTSLFFPSFYFANRKMWLCAMLAVLCKVLFCIPELLLTLSEEAGFTHLVEQFSMNSPSFSVLVNFCTVADLTASLLFCLFGNYLYYKRATRQIRQLKARPYTSEQLTERIRTEGGTSAINLLLMMVIVIAIAYSARFLVMFAL